MKEVTHVESRPKEKDIIVGLVEDLINKVIGTRPRNYKKDSIKRGIG